MKILGIHDGHNASAALIEDGRILAALQEERLTRHKNQGGFPGSAIKDVMEIADTGLEQIDQFVFGGYNVIRVKTREDILAKYSRRMAPKTRSPLSKFPEPWRWFRSEEKRRQRRLSTRQARRMAPLVRLGVPVEKIRFMEHHLCHAAAAYFGQGVMDQNILVLTCDGAGDGICASVNIGRDGTLKRLCQVAQENSIPFLYSVLTFITGFVPLEHEYKLMGLAPYSGNSAESQRVKEYFHTLFSFTPENPLTWERTPGTADAFQLGPQLKKYVEYKRFDNLAGGLQLFIEDFFIEWIRRTIKETGISKIALSGGLFMNVKLNKLIMQLPEVESIYVFPSCGDETNSIGAAWAAYAKTSSSRDRMMSIPPLGPFYLGGDFTETKVENTLARFQFGKQVRVVRCEDIEKRCAELLASGEVVARCKGPMEFGARALGNRSILSKADDWRAVKVINEMIKMRDFWMPFAPSILEEDAGEYLQNPKKVDAPYMIMAFDTRKEKLEKIIAATHPYDESCRPQVVKADWNPDYYRLIRYYKGLTGEGAILNTSLNLHGSPVVYTPEDALEVFEGSGLRYLALGNVMVEQVNFTP